jgi:hypothetical protein
MQNCGSIQIFHNHSRKAQLLSSERLMHLATLMIEEYSVTQTNRNACDIPCDRFFLLTYVATVYLNLSPIKVDVS